LFHIEASKDRKKFLASIFSELVDLEGEVFKGGYYMAFFIGRPLCPVQGMLEDDRETLSTSSQSTPGQGILRD